jgi:hypothetical protein
MLYSGTKHSWVFSIDLVHVVALSGSLVSNMFPTDLIPTQRSLCVISWLSDFVLSGKSRSLWREVVAAFLKCYSDAFCKDRENNQDGRFFGRNLNRCRADYELRL